VGEKGREGKERGGRKGEGRGEGWVGGPPCEILNTPLIAIFWESFPF